MHLAASGSMYHASGLTCSRLSNRMLASSSSSSSSATLFSSSRLRLFRDATWQEGGAKGSGGKGGGREGRGQGLSMMLHLYTYCSVTNDVISLLIGWYSLMSALQTPPPTLPFPVSSCGSPHATSVHMHTHTHMKGYIYYKFLHRQYKIVLYNRTAKLLL